MRPLLKELAEAIEQVTGVTLEQLKGPSTKGDVVIPRLYFYFIAHEIGLSFHEIGRTLNKNHTTVMSGVTNMSGYIDTNKINEIEVKRIKALLAY